jgi:hypothetical protein
MMQFCIPGQGEESANRKYLGSKQWMSYEGRLLLSIAFSFSREPVESRSQAV